jgi:hypothetical protein
VRRGLSLWLVLARMGKQAFMSNHCTQIAHVYPGAASATFEEVLSLVLWWATNALTDVLASLAVPRSIRLERATPRVSAIRFTGYPPVPAIATARSVFLPVQGQGPP